MFLITDILNNNVDSMELLGKFHIPFKQTRSFEFLRPDVIGLIIMEKRNLCVLRDIRTILIVYATLIFLFAFYEQ